MTTRNKGNTGELDALNYLQKLGFTLIQKNFQKRDGEIDIIMQDGEYLVFVEVKSLQKDSEYSIYETITSSKKSKIKKTTLNWLSGKGKLNSVWRVDFIGIIMNKDQVSEIIHEKFIDIGL